MDVEILHIMDCPNWQEAGRRLDAALVATGHGNVVTRYRLLETPADVVGTEFAGSPTITIDGVDVFPSEGRMSDLACRIFVTPGGLAGVPTVDQLIDGIRAHDH